MRIAVNTTTGQEVQILAEGRYPAGIHEVQWIPGTTANGVYIREMQTGNTCVGIKMVFQK